MATFCNFSNVQVLSPLFARKTLARTRLVLLAQSLLRATRRLSSMSAAPWGWHRSGRPATPRPLLPVQPPAPGQRSAVAPCPPPPVTVARLRGLPLRARVDHLRGLVSQPTSTTFPPRPPSLSTSVAGSRPLSTQYGSSRAPRAQVLVPRRSTRSY